MTRATSPSASSLPATQEACHFSSSTRRQLEFLLSTAKAVSSSDSAALLGSARGDDSAPGIGDRPLAKILPDERTTPAGRFSAELGENNHGEDILWVYYDNAISMHRVRSVKASEKRSQRLAFAYCDGQPHLLWLHQCPRCVL